MVYLIIKEFKTIGDITREVEKEIHYYMPKNESADADGLFITYINGDGVETKDYWSWSEIKEVRSFWK